MFGLIGPYYWVAPVSTITKRCTKYAHLGPNRQFPGTSLTGQNTVLAMFQWAELKFGPQCDDYVSFSKTDLDNPTEGWTKIKGGDDLRAHIKRAGQRILFSGTNKAGKRHWLLLKIMSSGQW